MKRKISFEIFILVALTIVITTWGYCGVNKWTATNGPNGGLFSFFVIPPGQDQIVFAGGGFLNAYRPLYKSTNGGSSWQRVMSEDQALVGLLRLDPLRPGRIVFGGLIQTMGFYESLDMGKTWKTIDSSLPFTPNDFEFDSFNPDIVYGVESAGFGSSAKFFRSSDGGKTWIKKSVIAHPKLDGADIEIDPTNSQTVYVVLGNGHIYKSVNGGTAFRDSSTGLPKLQKGVRSLALDRNNPLVIYSAGFEGVFKSTDGAITWKSTACNCRVREIDLDPTNTKNVYAVGRGDSGFEQAVKSLDGGQTWNKLNLPRFESHPYTAIAVDQVNSKVIFASSEIRGIFKSVNGGLTWRPSNRNVRLQTFNLVTDQKREGHMLAIGQDGFQLKNVVFETFNSGLSWQSLSNLDQYSIEKITIHPKDSRTIAAVSGITVQGSTIVLISVDGGKSWQQHGDGADVVFDPVRTNTIYRSENFKLDKSTDLGITWKSVTPPLANGESISDIEIDNRSGLQIYVSTSCSTDIDCFGSSRILKSFDAGTTWKNITSGLPKTDDFPDVEVDPKNPSVVYAVDGLQGGGLSKSTDGGQHWMGINDFPGYKLTIDRFNSKRLLSYNIGGDSLFISNDGGQSWNLFDSNGLFPERPYLQRTFISSVLFSPWVPKMIFAAIDGMKVYTQQ